MTDFDTIWAQAKNHSNSQKTKKTPVLVSFCGERGKFEVDAIGYV